MMTSDRKAENDPESTFSFGARELRQANAARELKVDDAPIKATNGKRGFDPYNTTGGFDRTKNWSRVSKR